MTGVLLGELLREARTSQGLTQAALAQRAGVSPHAIWEMERRGNGTVAIFERAATVLDLRLTGLPRAEGLGQRVRLARQRKGLSLDTLSKLAGISKPSAIRVENGIARIASLEAVLGVLVRDLRAHKPERTRWQSGGRDQRYTSPEVFEKIEGIVGKVDLDPAAGRGSPVVAKRYFYVEDDGLSQPWSASTVYVNPPYSDVLSFTAKARLEWESGRAQTIVMLLPVRTHGAAFHEHIAPCAHTYFLRERLSFLSEGRTQGKAPFGSMLVCFTHDETITNRVDEHFNSIHLPPVGISKGA